MTLSGLWGHHRVGAVLSADSCWRWPFDLAAELMPRPFPPLSSSYLSYSSQPALTFLVWPTQPTPKVLAPLRCTLGPHCCQHCPQPLSYTLAFLGHAYFKGPYSSIVSLCHFWGWGRALHPVLLPIWKKIIGFMNFPLPNFETSSYFHLTRSVYYFLKNYESYTFFVDKFFSNQFIHFDRQNGSRKFCGNFQYSANLRR